MPDCRKLRPGAAHDGRKGFSHVEGIAFETTGAQGICMHVPDIPPGGRAKAHRHATHETAILVLEGRAKMASGDGLEHVMEIEAGDLVYIPADVPHLPFNDGDAPARAVIGRDPPNEQERVVLLPHLDPLVPG